MNELRPVLIITCRAGSEEWCLEEIGNTLFPYDPAIKVIKTRYPGLLLVYSSLEVDRAYRIASGSEYGFIVNIIPIHYNGKLDDEFYKAFLNLVNYGEKIKLKLRIRGRRGLSKLVWNRLIDILKKKNSVHDPSSTIHIYVEILDDKVFIGRKEYRSSIL